LVHHSPPHDSSGLHAVDPDEVLHGSPVPSCAHTGQSVAMHDSSFSKSASGAPEYCVLHADWHAVVLQSSQQFSKFSHDVSVPQSVSSEQHLPFAHWSHCDADSLAPHAPVLASSPPLLPPPPLPPPPEPVLQPASP
jgi:hypothetical protein